MILLVLSSLIPLVGLLALMAFAIGMFLDLAEKLISSQQQGERSTSLAAPGTRTLLEPGGRRI
jgi:hypothetical protein